MNEQRIYLDNAATSWPKPEAVYEAVDRYQRDIGATAGRGAYREADLVDRTVMQARKRLSSFLGTDDPRRIIFTASGSDSLNMAIHGVVRPGDHVITSAVDHNSVLRPLRFLEENRNVEVTRVPCSPSGIVDPESFRAALRPNTRLIALVHASNVTGAIQPVAEVGAIAKEHGVLYLVDAAQSLGHFPIDVQQVGAQLFASPAHKGLMGPSGLGVLYIAPGVESQMDPYRQGGTGTQSDDDRQPDTLPDKYEPGNLNVPAVMGLAAALNYLEQRGLAEIRQHDQQLSARLLDGFASIRGVTIYGPCDVERQVGVVSISMDGVDPRELAGMLDSGHHVQVRAGIQCAPLMHQTLGTTRLGGTVRFSLGAFTTAEEIDTAVAAVSEIAQAVVQV
jgi:cysteine desulfurase/selenocysteine lyase